MKLTNAIKRLTNKGYEVKENDGVYTFAVDGFDYNFDSQDGEVRLLFVHVNYSDHPRFFPNLKKMLEYAEKRVQEETKQNEELKNKEQERKEKINKCFQILNENNVMIVAVKTLEEAQEIKEMYEKDGGKYLIKAPEQKTNPKQEQIYEIIEAQDVQEPVQEPNEKNILKIGQEIVYNEIVYIVKAIKNGMVGMVAAWAKGIARIIKIKDIVLNKDNETNDLEEIKPKEIKEFIKVIYPNINKNNTLTENDEEIQCNSYIENVKIVKISVVSDERFKYLSENLLNDEEEFMGDCGGTYVDDKYLDGVQEWSEEERQAYIKYGWRQGGLVVNEKTGEEFFVNNEGYNYARYVGRRA